MRLVISIRRASIWDGRDVIDRVVFDADDRNRRRIVLTGEKGTEFLLDFTKSVTLHDGDGLVLDDGAIVLEDMLRGLGAHLNAFEDPFDPEAAAPHGHEHDHGA